MSILRADSIRDRAGTGAPDFPNGLTGNVTGTATTATLANTATVATNAQGLTGTPNITVGTVGCGNVTSSGNISATDATFSGNLTVNGTTTTIDTAVTSVDSLAVDTKVAIGTDTYSTSDTVLQVNKNTSHAEFNIQSSNAHGSIINFSDTDSHNQGRIKYNHADNSLSIRTSGTDRFIINSTGTAIFKNGLAEKFHSGTTLQADPTLGLSEGNLFYRSSNESGNQAVNFTGIHGVLAIGEAASFTVVITPNGSGAINAVQVDSVAQSVLRWSGGSAPSASASGKDVYTFTIFKTGGTTTDYEIYGAATNYA